MGDINISNHPGGIVNIHGNSFPSISSLSYMTTDASVMDSSFGSYGVMSVSSAPGRDVRIEDEPWEPDEPYYRCAYCGMGRVSRIGPCASCGGPWEENSKRPSIPLVPGTMDWKATLNLEEMEDVYSILGDYVANKMMEMPKKASILKRLLGGR